MMKQCPDVSHALEERRPGSVCNRHYTLHACSFSYFSSGRVAQNPVIYTAYIQLVGRWSSRGSGSRNVFRMGVAEHKGPNETVLKKILQRWFSRHV